MGIAEQDFGWLKTVASASAILSNKAEQVAATNTILGEAADAQSQLVAFMEYIIDAPAERSYQTQQANELAAKLNPETQDGEADD